jgi:hypothetical protein
MRILFEGESYSIELLDRIFEDSKFYFAKDGYGTINAVGYYHSFKKKSLVYILPKVFVKKKMAFGYVDIMELATEESSQKKSEMLFRISNLSFLFYKTLKEFLSRNRQNIIATPEARSEIQTSLEDGEYAYVDLVLSFVQFYKKNHSAINFYHKEWTNSSNKPPQWEKTIRTSTPILSGNASIYTNTKGKRNVIDRDEKLLYCFFSILNYFNDTHSLSININNIYSFCQGREFERLRARGIATLKKIKHNYFSDIFKRMYFLCETFFKETDVTNIRKSKEDFIVVKNYNIVFEDMIDKLLTFSDSNVESEAISKLKHNKDGKLIDHIFTCKSLFDTTNTFCIGDSKYYKSENTVDGLSIYKQFTYAKNIIQYNLDSYHAGRSYLLGTKTRDDRTEGYNLIPNFFIFGYMPDEIDFEEPMILSDTKSHRSFHYEDRLFDRDTLFILQYQINFLFVLNAYVTSNNIFVSKFRREIRELFRERMINYLNSPDICGFEFFIRQFQEKELEIFLNANFKQLNGKCLLINGNSLIFAKYFKDSTVDILSLGFKRTVLQ